MPRALTGKQLSRSQCRSDCRDDEDGDEEDRQHSRVHVTSLLHRHTYHLLACAVPFVIHAASKRHGPETATAG
jgi:hypothetical protein